MVGIYKITSPSNYVYIGQSRNIKQRWAVHRYDANCNKPEYPLCRSIKKHGLKSHTFQVVHELPKDVSKEVLTNYEQFYMNAYKESGFILLNVNPAAGSRAGTVHTEEAKERISKAHRARIWSDEHRKNHSEANKKRTGYKHGEETKKKISIRATGRKNPSSSILRKGIKLSEEHKRNISLGGLGKKDSEQTKKNKSNAAFLTWQKRRERDGF